MTVQRKMIIPLLLALYKVVLRQWGQEISPFLSSPLWWTEFSKLGPIHPILTYKKTSGHSSTKGVVIWGVKHESGTDAFHPKMLSLLSCS